jgi:hypothetical protein
MMDRNVERELRSQCKFIRVMNATKQNNALHHTGRAQTFSFEQTRDGESIGIAQCARSVEQAMAIAIGFDHGEDARARRHGAHAGQIVRERRAIDIRYGAKRTGHRT